LVAAGVEGGIVVVIFPAGIDISVGDVLSES